MGKDIGREELVHHVIAKFSSFFLALISHPCAHGMKPLLFMHAGQLFNSHNYASFATIEGTQGRSFC